MASLPICVVDAFAAGPFTGNPAAVCLLSAPLEDGLMRRIAREMNLSETAFVLLGADADPAAGLDLRWFTPEAEVPLCGHATLATAQVLLVERGLGGDRIAFRTRSGRLVVTRDGDGLVMDFPADRPVPAPAPPGLREALGAPEPVAVFRGERTGKWVLRLESAAAVTGLAPDFRALRALPGADWRGAGVTAEAGDGRLDCVSRYFNPWAGVDEDPVTGSVHTLLATYWAGILGKDHLLARQASSRGGELSLRLRGDRVELGGRARVVLRGELDLD